MDITSTHALQSAFAETYAKPDEPHPLRQFECYELIMEHRENEPNTGARKLSRRMNLTESKLDNWFRGSAPRGYKQTEALADIGWFDLSWHGEQFRAINELLAWLYSSGGIRSGYQPQFVFDNTEMRDRIETLCATAGVECRRVREGRDDRPSTIRVTDPSAPVGRFFHALGAPTGRKADQRFGLPSYLDVAPDDVRRAFAARYIQNRGTDRPNFADNAKLLREERHPAYFEALRALFRSLTDAEVSRSGDRGIHISGAAVADIVTE
jgi:hypothetical protein